LLQTAGGRARRLLGQALLVAAASALLSACAHRAAPAGPGPAGAEVRAPASSEGVLARNERMLIYLPTAQDSFATIAARFLGAAGRDWEVAEANAGAKLVPGYPVVVPLRPANPLGLRSDQLQTISILCYHRVGNGANKMTVSAAAFGQQLDWLAANGYRVIRLRDLQGFLEGRQALPRRSVVLTFDDGYESYYRFAYPLIKKHNVPATVFLYTDFVGAGDALTWPQMAEMTASGLIDIQAHSKTHANLLDRYRDENEAAYRQRMESEVRLPREQIQRKLRQDVSLYAYPYGDANETVLDVLSAQRYQLGVTVNPGGTPFYAQPLMLRRTMIYGTHDLEAFKARVETSRSIVLP
jgi:peptidoglycan/xylan/chitin deacetylase (PgdA/CDA1 family)